jgi:hypothetical protein
MCAVLAAITWLIFGQTLGHQFVTCDDPQYVYENAKIIARRPFVGRGSPGLLHTQSPVTLAPARLRAVQLTIGRRRSTHLAARIYPIAGKQLRGQRPRTSKSKTAELCEEPGRCEFVLADF